MQGCGVADFDGVLDSGGVQLIEQLGGMPFGDCQQKPAGGLRIEGNFNEAFANAAIDGHFVVQIFSVAFAAAGNVALFGQAYGAAQRRHFCRFHRPW